MGPLTAKLIEEMSELSSLLERVGEGSWSSAVKNAHSYLSSSNYRGIEEAKTWFGTSGTLNDLILHPINGHKIPEQEIDQVNSKLRTLSSNIYDLIKEVERNTSFE